MCTARGILQAAGATRRVTDSTLNLTRTRLRLSCQCTSSGTTVCNTFGWRIPDEVRSWSLLGERRPYCCREADGLPGTECTTRLLY